MENPRLNRALSNWQDWPLNLTKPPAVVGELSGFTNQSVVLDADDQLFVLRLNRIGADSLGIYRDQEYLIWQAVANLGIAPELLYKDSLQDYALYQYIEGRVWTPDDLHSPDQIERLGNLVKDYQQISIDLPARNYIEYLEHYWNQIRQLSVTTPQLIAEWQDFQPKLNSLQYSEWKPVLSHHDLIPENIIDTGQQLYIVDWEYAALGHPKLDWCVLGENNNHPINRVVDWINRLWWLLVNNTGNQQT